MKVPKCFLGRPKLWDVYQNTPKEQWAFKAAAMIEYLKPGESPVLEVPRDICVSHKAAIVLYNLLLDMSKEGLPFMTKLADLSQVTGYHRSAVCRAMSNLRKREVIDYKKVGCAGLMVRVVLN